MLGSRLKKRGQGIYILMGIVVLIIFLIGFYVYSSKAEAKATEEELKILEESIIPSLKVYMKQSIDQAGIDVIKKIGSHGGTFNPGPSTWKGVIEIAYTCYKENPQLACVNTFLARQHIEKELADKILKNLDEIIDLTKFREQGIDIEEGSRKVRVILGKTALVVELYYPLTLSIKNKVEKIEVFQSTIDLPLGILYDLSRHITNTETQQVQFNITEWYQKHPDLFINIERERAGDDQVFQLVKDGYIFNFALQKTGLEEAQYGCCYDRYDMSCFKNVPEEQCNEIGGEYDPNPLCICPTEGRLSCVVSLPGAGCIYPYAEVLRLSGYENAHASLPGAGGFSYSLCCNIVAFFITQEPDIVGTDCTGGAVFARLSSAGSAHADDPGNEASHFTEKACISAENNRITCRAREGVCLGEEEPILSFTDPVNSHAGHSYRYDYKICCRAEKTA